MKLLSSLLKLWPISLTFNCPPSIYFLFYLLNIGNFAPFTNSRYLNSTLVNQTFLVVGLPADDLNLIKTSIHSGGVLDCLVFTKGMVHDLLGNAIEGNLPESPVYLNPTLYTPDTVPPVLLEFQVNLMTYTLTLTFNEIVDPTSFRPSEIFLLSHSSFQHSGSAKIQLTNYTVVERDPANDNNILLSIDFYLKDSYLLDSNPHVCKNVTNCYIALKGLADIFGNEYSSYRVFAASLLVANTAPLQIYSFDFLPDLVTGRTVINVYFSRVVLLSTFSCADLVVCSSVVLGHSVRLTSCTILSQENNIVIQFSVSNYVFPNPVGTSQVATLLHTVSSPVTTDIYGNSLSAIPQSASIEVGPRAIRFSVDMNSGSVMLALASNVFLLNSTASSNVSSLGFYTITLASPPDSSVNLYTANSTYLQDDSESALRLFNPLQATSLPYGSNGSVLHLQLSNGNLNKLKMLSPTATSLFLLLESSLPVVDIYGQPFSAISFPFVSPDKPSPFETGGQLLVSRFVADTLNPYLQLITLDMGTQLLSLTFNEPIRLSTVDVTAIRLQQFKYISQDQDGSGQYNYLRLTGTNPIEGFYNRSQFIDSKFIVSSFNSIYFHIF